MRAQITILSTGEGLKQRHPFHPDTALREATAKALNEGAAMPREGIVAGSEQGVDYSLDVAWLHLGAVRFALASRSFLVAMQTGRPSGWTKWTPLTRSMDVAP